MPISVYEMSLAGHSLRYVFIRPQTKYYFRPFLHRSRSEEWDIRLTPAQLEHYRPLYPASFPDAYVEFRSLRLLSSQFLMNHACCIFHATAFLFQGGAWLLTAPSGTGKTTQYLNWQRLFPGEIEMICGDMPALELRDASVWVHPSPWNGKENIGGTRSAPLAGIVFLEQGSENRLSEIEPPKMVKAAFQQLVGRPGSERHCRNVAALLDAALRLSRVRCFVNRGDDASTELLRQWIREEEA